MRVMPCLVVALVTLGSPGPVAAQSAAEYRRRLDTLYPQYVAAKEAVARKERDRQEAARATLVERGPLRLLVDSALVPIIDEPATLTAQEIERTFGQSAQILSERQLVVRQRVLGQMDGQPVQTVRLGVDGREQSISMADPAITRQQLLAVLRGAAVTSPIHAALDDSLRNWFRAALYAGTETAEERERVYVGLVTGSTDISRRCLAGDLVGCRQLIGLAPVGDPLIDGHTAAQRRSAVVSRRTVLRTGRGAGEYDRCVADYDDSACIARLRTLPAAVFARSMGSTDMNRSFARFVLARGSEGAYDRLRTADSLPLAARFAVAGRAPTDTLIAGWRAHILAARPERTPVTPITALATLAWIVAGGALALRSSRWR